MVVSFCMLFLSSHGMGPIPMAWEYPADGKNEHPLWSILKNRTQKTNNSIQKRKKVKVPPSNKQVPMKIEDASKNKS